MSVLLVSAAAITFSLAAPAQQGGCVAGETAPIYASADGDKIEATAQRGDCVAGVRAFERKGERIRVRYFPNKDQKGIDRTAWMMPSDLTFFDYDCKCDKKGRCDPKELHFGWEEWNPCFKTARDRLLAELARPQGIASQSVKALTNDDVIALTKAGLEDEIVVAKVQAAPAVEFDTSIDALIRLKQEGVGKNAIAAMVKEPHRVAPAPGTTATALRVTTAADVRVTSNPDAVKGCVSRGTVHAKVDAFFGKGPENATRALQAAAVAKGANVVLLIGGFTDRDDGSSLKVMGNGEAYACPVQ